MEAEVQDASVVVLRGFCLMLVFLASISALPLSPSSWVCPVGTCLNWGGYSVPASLEEV